MKVSLRFDNALGIAGRAALDGRFPNATFAVEGKRVMIHTEIRDHVLITEENPTPGSKVSGVISDELWADAGEVRVAGSGPNTCIAAKMADPNVALRYLDACTPAAPVLARLACAGLAIRHLGLESVPTNILLGTGNNRTIIKQSKADVRAFTSGHRTALQWLTRCRRVRANSVKHLEIAEYLVREADAGNIELDVVPTPYLAPDYVAAHWLRAATEICTSQDEIGKVMGWDVDQSLADAPAVIARLRRLNSRAIIHLTRGEDGVVVSMPEEVEPVHIRLQRDWEGVQEFVARDPTVLCGAGDAYATGSTLWLHSGCSVIEGLNASLPQAVKAALAASALALRWIGWRPKVHQADFTIHRMRIPVRVAA